MKRKILYAIEVIIALLAIGFVVFYYMSGSNIDLKEQAGITLNDYFSEVDCSSIGDTNDVIESGNLSGCDCFEDVAKDSCRVSVSNALFYEQALIQSDIEICKEISVEQISQGCINLVTKKIASIESSTEGVTLGDLNYSDSITILENLLIKNPEDVNNLNLLAISYAQRALAEYSEDVDIPKALELLDRAKKLEPNNPEIYRVGGFVFEVQPDLDKAIASYNKSLELDENYLLAYVGRGHTLEVLGDTQGAIDDYLIAASIDTNNELINVYSNLCRLGIYLGIVDLSIENCEIVIDSEFGTSAAKAEANQIVGSTYSTLGRYDEAWTYFNNAEIYNPGDINLKLVIAEMYIEQGEYLQAEGYSRDAIKIDPKKSIAHEKLGTSLLGQERYQESIESSLEALNLLSADPSVLVRYKNSVAFRVYITLINAYGSIGDTENKALYEVLITQL